MTDATAQAETDRQINRLADEVLDYRQTLERICVLAVSRDVVSASVLTLAERIQAVRTEARQALVKDRRC